MRIDLPVQSPATITKDASTPIGIMPYTVMLAGNAADLWTTIAAVRTGQARESNSFLLGQGVPRIAAVKVTGVAALAVVMRVLETHGHPKAAKILGYVDGGVTFAVAAHNHQVAR